MSLQKNSLEGGDWVQDIFAYFTGGKLCSKQASDYAHYILMTAIVYAVCLKYGWTGFPLFNYIVNNILSVFPSFLIKIFNILVHDIQGYFMKLDLLQDGFDKIKKLVENNLMNTLSTYVILGMAAYILGFGAGLGALQSVYLRLHDSLCLTLTGPLYYLGLSERGYFENVNTQTLKKYRKNNYK